MQFLEQDSHNLKVADRNAHFTFPPSKLDQKKKKKKKPATKDFLSQTIKLHAEIS